MQRGRSSGVGRHRTRSRRLRAALLIAWVIVPAGGLAQTTPLELKWNELAPMVTGHTVTLTLTEGTKVKGEAVAVRDDGMLLNISMAVKGYAKGNGSVPRSSIVSIDLLRTRGSWGRIMGTVIGTLGGMALGAWVDARNNVLNSSVGRVTGTFVGIASAGAVAGYFGGRALDNRVTHIRVVP